jgi:glucan biosynthesis protein C
MEARTHANWIDWLKVLAVLGVFYYHTALIFATTPWVINNHQHSLILSGIAGFGYLFGMPLLFLLSGSASWYALRRRTAGEFAVLRFKRLVLPLAAGLVLLSPLQAYLSAASRGPVGTLPSFFVRFFEGVDLYGSPRWLGTYGYHLWFLGFLFAYSILALPFLSWLHRPAGRALIDWLADLSQRSFGLLLFVLPMLLVQAALRVRYPALQDWADFGFWFVFFVSGYVVAGDPRIAAAIARNWRVILTLRSCSQWSCFR